jgi:hypothetical protein
MGKIILYILLVGLILLIGSAIWPYVNKYFINSDLKEAALYGTKHSIEETQELLNKKLKDRGLIFKPEELSINKSEHKTVIIRLNYKDKMSFLGIVLKELEFKLEVKEMNVKEFL